MYSNTKHTRSYAFGGGSVQTFRMPTHAQVFGLSFWNYHADGPGSLGTYLVSFEDKNPVHFTNRQFLRDGKEIVDGNISRCAFRRTVEDQKSLVFIPLEPGANYVTLPERTIIAHADKCSGFWVDYPKNGQLVMQRRKFWVYRCAYGANCSVPDDLARSLEPVGFCSVLAPGIEPMEIFEDIREGHF